MKVARKRMIGDSILEYIRMAFPSLTESDMQLVVGNVYQRLRKSNNLRKSGGNHEKNDRN